MAKYYVSCGSLQVIRDSKKDALGAAMDSVWELNEFDILDEYFYIDERGFRTYVSAEPDTTVIETAKVLQEAGWTIE